MPNFTKFGEQVCMTQ